MMDARTVIAIVGGISLLVGLLGGGFRAKDVDIPKIPPLLRMVSSIVGAVLLIGALSYSPSSAPPTAVSQQATTQSTPTSSPKSSDGGTGRPDTRPSLTLSQEITDERGDAINRQKAPFKIRVTGTAVDVSGLYVYLVVNDTDAEWIEPITAGLGPHVGKDFSGFCYLGVEDEPTSINRLYKVFAVATTRAYKEYEKLDRSTIQAESSAIRVFRVR